MTILQVTVLTSCTLFLPPIFISSSASCFPCAYPLLTPLPRYNLLGQVTCLAYATDWVAWSVCLSVRWSPLKALQKQLNWLRWAQGTMLYGGADHPWEGALLWDVPTHFPSKTIGSFHAAGAHRCTSYKGLCGSDDAVWCYYYCSNCSILQYSTAVVKWGNYHTVTNDI